MSKPYIHAKSSVLRFGGKPEDYIATHQFLDSSKEHVADHRHRALLHSTFGCFVIEKMFGQVATNSEGKEFSPRDVAEQHIVEDLGHIPTVQDWLQDLPLKEWMGGGKKEEIPSSNAITNYKTARQALESLGKKLKKEVEAALCQEFEKTPYEAISWTTYVPGFNDGEPCTFSVGQVYGTKQQLTPKQQKVWRDETNPDGWDAEEHGAVEVVEEYIDAESAEKEGYEPIGSIVNENADLLEKAFGTDTHVTWIRGKGIKVEHYDCGY
jgi:hypothetical protein